MPGGGSPPALALVWPAWRALISLVRGASRHPVVNPGRPAANTGTGRDLALLALAVLLSDWPISMWRDCAACSDLSAYRSVLGINVNAWAILGLLLYLIVAAHRHWGPSHAAFCSAARCFMCGFCGNSAWPAQRAWRSTPSSWPWS